MTRATHAKAIARVRSGAVDGIEAREVLVEADFAEPGRGVNVIGLPDTAMRESRTRVLHAVESLPMRSLANKVIINLAPATLRKEGSALDLPMAVAVAARVAREHWPRLDDWLVAGEIGLDGAVTRMNGALLLAVLARRLGLKGVVVPESSVAEAAVVDGIHVVGARHLDEVVRFLRDGDVLAPVVGRRPDEAAAAAPHADDFRDIRGQESAKRALMVAAAGAHNVMMIGPPGSGKTMLARAFPGILPNLSLAEAVDTACIYAAASLNRQGDFYRAPFRAPHHTASRQAIAGGGFMPAPGEVSLAHNGVLFLDEVPEFHRDVLEVLRQPLEDGSVTIARARESRTFPARFQLIGAMNPCPCGFAGDGSGRCRCPPARVDRYRAQISGPLLDRMDIHLPVVRVRVDFDRADPVALDTAAALASVAAARERQALRYKGESFQLNAQLPGRRLGRHCRLTSSLKDRLAIVLRRLHLSNRAHVRILRVARTIADLDASDSIQEPHLLEAIQYRSLDREP